MPSFQASADGQTVDVAYVRCDSFRSASRNWHSRLADAYVWFSPGYGECAVPSRTYPRISAQCFFAQSTTGTAVLALSACQSCLEAMQVPDRALAAICRSNIVAVVVPAVPRDGLC